MSLIIQNRPARDLMNSRDPPLTVCNSNTRLRLPSYTDEMPTAKFAHSTRADEPRQRSLSHQLRQRIEVRHNRDRVTSLQKTARSRDDKRWDLRGDQVLRQDWLRQQRQWESQLARSAPDVSARVEDEDMEDVIESGETSNRYPVDDIVSYEEQAVTALVSLLEEDQLAPQNNSPENPTKHDFDDEEYDRLLAEVAAEGTGHEQPMLEASGSIERQGQDIEMMLD